MGYYMRVLLEEWEERPLSDLIAHSRAYGHPLRADGPVDEPAWREANLFGPEGSGPVEVEVNLDDGTPECLVRDEVEQFREEVEDSEADADAMRRVLEHLEGTKAIVAIRVLASDSERGLEAAWVVLDYYAQRPGVLFQADAEGFYEGEELIVPVS